VARWNYSLLDDATLESVAGVEWENCCLAARLLHRHYVRNIDGNTNTSLYLELELKGLSTLGRKSEELLRRGILGYSR
jgi:LPS-assembly protein